MSAKIIKKKDMCEKLFEQYLEHSKLSIHASYCFTT